MTVSPEVSSERDNVTVMPFLPYVGLHCVAEESHRLFGPL
jgi:hypothetical protein